jgi:hypothetical protein
MPGPPVNRRNSQSQQLWRHVCSQGSIAWHSSACYSRHGTVQSGVPVFTAASVAAAGAASAGSACSFPAASKACRRFCTNCLAWSYSLMSRAFSRLHIEHCASSKWHSILMRSCFVSYSCLRWSMHAYPYTDWITRTQAQTLQHAPNHSIHKLLSCAFLDRVTGRKPDTSTHAACCLDRVAILKKPPGLHSC